jgi:hypothetical protein
MSICRFPKSQILFFIFSCVVFFLFSSCEKEDDAIRHSIDYKLEPYLNRFLEEGIKRGKMVDISKNGGLILEFADLTPPTIGLCYFSKPVRVQIDRTYWEETTKSPNRENLREEVVFHELGHGFLSRGHRNDVLQNNEWTSMMCGEPQTNGRSWNLNFNGYRKEYYLDELFNPKIPVPEWSKPAVFDGNKGTLLYSEDYSFSVPRFQSEGPLTFEIKNGEYRISSSVNQNQRVALLYDFPLSTDFYMEMEMSVFFALNNGEFSGVFAENVYSDYNYFSITSNNRSFVANNKCIMPFAEVLISDKYQREKYNKLAISKCGDELFFHINDKLVYRNDYQLFSYNKLGIIIPAKGSVSIKNYAVYADENTSLRSMKQTENPVVLGEIAIRKIKYLR